MNNYFLIASQIMVIFCIFLVDFLLDMDFISS